ncbi:MAG: DUF1080 domain-containing protein [Chthonomonadales bacterium]
MAANSRLNASKLGMVASCIALCTCGAYVIGHTQDDGPLVFGPKEDRSKPQRIPKNSAIKVLFGGKQAGLDANWQNRGAAKPAWIVSRDGFLEVKPGSGDIGTKEKFQDFQLHIEFKVPYMPEGKGQGRGNSGVFLQSRYEIQLLDSYGFKSPGMGDCGAVYNKSAPLVNACKEPLQWQTYDITFRTARRDSSGKVVENVRVSVIQNGIVVQNNTEIVGVCGAAEDNAEGTPGRIRLQDHGNKMQFRNIWILPLPEQGNKDYSPH